MKEIKSILLVEDDKNLSMLLKEFLEVKGFKVVQAFNGEEGLYILKENSFSIFIVDVMMPKMDGFTFTQKLIEKKNKTPFLFLTAKSMLDDKLKGLKIGADDFVTKPFSMEELILRINAILRRTSLELNNYEEESFKIGSYVFEFEKRLLKGENISQKLTVKESELLRLLCINKNKVLERGEALNAIWKNENYFTARSMDVYITKLRSYLKQDTSIEIVNLHGTGYKLQCKN